MEKETTMRQRALGLAPLVLCAAIVGCGGETKTTPATKTTPTATTPTPKTPTP